MCREDSSTPMLVDPSQETPHVHGEDRTNASAGTARRGFQKHPHVRGEDCRRPGSAVCPSETPPRAWGRRHRRRRDRAMRRNTPTCVGKTWAAMGLQIRKEKHPHVRGEDFAALKSQTSPMETPPRAWGRRSRGRTRAISVRNTPTCVGKTRSQRNPCAGW